MSASPFDQIRAAVLAATDEAARSPVDTEPGTQQESLIARPWSVSWLERSQPPEPEREEVAVQPNSACVLWLTQLTEMLQASHVEAWSPLEREQLRMRLKSLVELYDELGH